MRSYLSMSFSDFCNEKEERLLSQIINANSGFDIQETQKRAWEKQIQILQPILTNFINGRVIFEFTIPRVGKRVDVILVFEKVIFIIEFKVNGENYVNADKDQTLDYAIDLKNFHETSHDVQISPILIATKAKAETIKTAVFADGVFELNLCNVSTLEAFIYEIIDKCSETHNTIEIKKWENGRYKPTPTIVEAAKALYEGHSVSDISRSEAGAENLTKTSSYVQQIIEEAKSKNKKVICFITGVPGSGKTLAGLNIATNALQVTQSRDGAVFLSGNGPLVSVLQEALARNEIQNAKENGKKPPSKTEALRKSRLFVQIIHRWRDEYLIDKTAPEGRIVVFDEAQRAWTLEQTTNFMKTKKQQENFNMSEPEYLLSVMGRHDGWCAVICLIGGGQEINRGEAGIDEWLEAASKSTAGWELYLSNKLSSSDYFKKLPKLPENSLRDSRLHLSTSVRSFRAEALSNFVGAILEGDVENAVKIRGRLNNYPIFLSRDIEEIRDWLRKKARGSERIGLVASSNALRLKSEGIHVKSGIDPAMWFLNGKEDVRSSYSLEDAATEFDIQGLELDWVGMCWDANLMWQNGNWKVRRFRGTNWQTINNPDSIKYVINSYRVLLTRARQGMAILVPNGSKDDLTRKPSYYDETYKLLEKCMNA